MSNQTALNEIYDTLHGIGVVDTKKEFFEDWLNRSEGYLRALKHYNKQPSTDALAVCSSKLKHYSRLLNQKADRKYTDIASVFSEHSLKLDTLIFNNSTTKWMNLLEEEKTETTH